MMENKKYLIGLDIGMMQDYSALCMIEQIEEVKPANLVERILEHYEVRYNLTHIEQFPLGTQFPAVVKRVSEIVYNPEIERNNKLIIDATGIGEAIVQMFREKSILPVSIVITGGAEVTKPRSKYEIYHVPKRDLVSALMKIVQSGRFKIADGLALGRLFDEQLSMFHYTLNKKTGHDSYEAAKDSIHDDIVLAAALAAWYGIKYERHMQEFFDSNANDDERQNERFDYLQGRPY
jgi:hypothetical protein